MTEYIEREKAIDACFDGWNNNAHDCAENIRLIPAADVRPVVRGEWDFYDSFALKCSNCGWINYHNMGVPNMFNFCPNCGAEMEES